jgi:hypothetical protein
MHWLHKEIKKGRMIMTPDFERIDRAIGFAEKGKAVVKVKGDGTFDLDWNQDVWLCDEAANYDDDGNDLPLDPEVVAAVPEGFCKTQCCIAGYIDIDAGYIPIKKSWGEWTSVRQIETGDEGSPGLIARKLARLTNSEAERLFGGSNDLEDLKCARDRLAHDHGVELRWPALYKARYGAAALSG